METRACTLTDSCCGLVTIICHVHTSHPLRSISKRWVGEPFVGPNGGARDRSAALAIHPGTLHSLYRVTLPTREQKGGQAELSRSRPIGMDHVALGRKSVDNLSRSNSPGSDWKPPGNG